MGLEEIGSFVEVAEQGSLAAAARVLGLPKSTVSRRIARLEQELGQELVRRGARALRLTEAGEVLYQRSAPAVRELVDAARLFRDGGAAPNGDLRLTLPVELALSAAFARLLAQ